MNDRIRRCYAAARRVPPRACGCPDDSWPCRCRKLPISDQMADAAVSAAELLNEVGAPGIFDRPTCQAMWRRGHRDLAVACDRYSGGEAT